MLDYGSLILIRPIADRIADTGRSVEASPGKLLVISSIAAGHVVASM